MHKAALEVKATQFREAIKAKELELTVAVQEAKEERHILEVKVLGEKRKFTKASKTNRAAWQAEKAILKQEMDGMDYDFRDSRPYV
jgi:hypothetical protein